MNFTRPCGFVRYQDGEQDGAFTCLVQAYLYSLNLYAKNLSSRCQTTEAAVIQGFYGMTVMTDYLLIARRF
ncbi:MAG: hypothetical protein ACOVSW_07995 [Candidatus Kapaibacteriota bacterium]